MLYLPIVIPEIVMGISLLAFFATVEIPLGITTLVIAHITFSVPFVVVVVRARLEGFDRSIEEAAMDLGANEWQTFVRVTSRLSHLALSPELCSPLPFPLTTSSSVSSLPDRAARRCR